MTASTGCAESVSGSFSLMKYFVSIAIIIGVALLPAPLYAQGPLGGPAAGAARMDSLRSMTDRGSVDVYLKTPSGAPIKDAVVTIFQVSGQPYEQLAAKAEVV